MSSRGTETFHHTVVSHYALPCSHMRSTFLRKPFTEKTVETKLRFLHLLNIYDCGFQLLPVFLTNEVSVKSSRRRAGAPGRPLGLGTHHDGWPRPWRTSPGPPSCRPDRRTDLPPRPTGPGPCTAAGPAPPRRLEGGHGTDAQQRRAKTSRDFKISLHKLQL